MSSDNLNLFVVINESKKLFFVAGKLDENQNFKVIEKSEINNEYTNLSELINMSLKSDLIKQESK